MSYWLFNKSIKFLLIYWSFFIASTASAGGDYFLVKVKEVSSAQKSALIKLMLKEEPRHPINGCEFITVHVRYQNDLMTWLPFVTSRDPTRNETLIAIQYIIGKYKKEENMYFGYMAGGLNGRENEKCIFDSKGFRLKSDSNHNRNIVFSYYDYY